MPPVGHRECGSSGRAGRRPRSQTAAHTSQAARASAVRLRRRPGLSHHRGVCRRGIAYVSAVWPRAARLLTRRVVLAAALGVLAALHAEAQTAVSVPLDGVDPKALLEALALECYEAGLAADLPGDSSMDC